MPQPVATVSNFGFAGADDATEGRELTYIGAISEALRDEMRRDPRVLVLGEDIAGEFGGAFKLTRGLPRELLAAWEARDPVIGFRRKLSAEGIGDEQLDEIERRCREEVEDAVAFAEASPWPDPATVSDGVYAP